MPSLQPCLLFYLAGIADPVASIIVAVLVLYSGWQVTIDSLHVLMEGVPRNVDIEDVIQTMTGISGVISIHDLHVWSITSGQNALSCHVVVDGDLSISESQTILRAIEHELFQKGIQHVTIQLENSIRMLIRHVNNYETHVHHHTLIEISPF